MLLALFIRTHLEAILDEWERFAREIKHASSMSAVELRDHARGILNAIATDLESYQTAAEQEDRSKGRGPLEPQVTEAELHGMSRFGEGFDVNEAIAEYRALRASVLRMWGASQAEAIDITRFNEAIDQAVAESLAQFSLPLALLFVDLDGFKEVNDRLGHGAGDELLQQVARRIALHVRATDTVARLGGDEFTVILTDITRVPHIDKIAADILADLRKPIALTAGITAISASIGISVYPGDGVAPDELVHNADAAMYAAKSAGRNCYHFWGA